METRTLKKKEKEKEKKKEEREKVVFLVIGANSRSSGNSLCFTIGV